MKQGIKTWKWWKNMGKWYTGLLIPKYAMARMQTMCYQSRYLPEFLAFLNVLEYPLIKRTGESGPMTDDAFLLDECLGRLSDRYRVVIHLYYYERMSTAKIAEVLRIKDATVRMWLIRARRTLKKFMESEE
jgi:hypothetical protein